MIRTIAMVFMLLTGLSTQANAWRLKNVTNAQVQIAKAYNARFSPIVRMKANQVKVLSSHVVGGGRAPKIRLKGIIQAGRLGRIEFRALKTPDRADRLQLLRGNIDFTLYRMSPISN